VLGPGRVVAEPGGGAAKTVGVIPGAVELAPLMGVGIEVPRVVTDESPEGRGRVEHVPPHSGRHSGRYVDADTLYGGHAATGMTLAWPEP
jgi:hypothetical protein